MKEVKTIFKQVIVLLLVGTLLALVGFSQTTPTESVTISPASLILGPPTETKLIASDAATGDQFGWSVSISGDTIAIGADTDDTAGGGAGSTYVFQQSGGTWTQQAELATSDADILDFFGYAVSISGDTLVASAIGDSGAGLDSGSAYLFQRNSGTWVELVKLLPSDGTSFDRFGHAVAISGDTLVVTAREDDPGDVTGAGSAYVFQESGGIWSETAKLIAGDGALEDQFGQAVAIDGDTIVIGANLDDDRGLDSGSVYVFQGGGSGWGQQAKLTASTGADGDQFGYTVSISDDTIVIGAPFDDDLGNHLSFAMKLNW